jgi:hypothetical protein
VAADSIFLLADQQADPGGRDGLVAEVGSSCRSRSRYIPEFALSSAPRGHGVASAHHTSGMDESTGGYTTATTPQCV